MSEDRNDAARRRAEALRANLARRKAQTHARRGGKGVGKAEPTAFGPVAGPSSDAGGGDDGQR